MTARKALPALILLVALLAVAVSPGLRAQLRMSFTRLPSEYTELYFTADPVLAGTVQRPVIEVSVAVLHHGRAAEPFTVRVTVTSASSATGPAVEKALTGDPEKPEPIEVTFAVPGRNTAYDVRVALVGLPQTLQFRLETKDAA